MEVGGMNAAPSGALVKQHLGSVTSGFASVKPHSVNLHPGDPPLSLVTKVTGAFAEARISKKNSVVTVMWIQVFVKSGEALGQAGTPHAGELSVGEQRGGFYRLTPLPPTPSSKRGIPYAYIV